MEKKIMYLFSRTPVHVGAGNSVGAIDSPIQRERHTRIPIIPGSSLKGVLADLWNDEENLEKNAKDDLVRKKDSTVAILFGQEKDDKRGTMDSAGALLIGEARVLAFPVRSAKGAFAWITCPLALARYKRDAGADFELPAEEIKESECLASEGVKLQGKVVLEEYCFNSKDHMKIDGKIIEAFAKIKNDDVWKTSVASRLVIVSDEIFSYFVENACEVVTRIQVSDETGTVVKGALFNQEQVPSETMFYAVIAAQDEKGKKENKMKAKEILEKLEKKIDAKILQVGGDETIGLGYCSVNFGGN